MNVNPFRRHRPAGDSPVESALRRSLARHAFETPDADDVMRRVLASAALSGADDEPDPAHAGEPDDHADRGPWRTWGLPLVAAAAVIAVVGVGAAIASFDNGNGHGNRHQAATAGPSTAHATVTTTRTVTPTAGPRSLATTHASRTSGLQDVKILDLTFFGTDDGIALASAKCLTGPGRCTALLQTTDGTIWTQKGGGIDFDVPDVTKGCPADKCVDHIRFATAEDGYAYGPDAFFVTTDGGLSWQKQPGGAAALESLGGNVIRVEPSGPKGACLPGCDYTVQTAGIGKTNWTTVPLPVGAPVGDGVQLSRGGTGQRSAYLLVTQNPAGGSSDERSTLYSSSDDGASWTNEAEPCPQLGGEIDSYQVVAGSGENVSALCRTRATGPFRVARSTDGGRHFSMQSASIAYADVASTGYTDTGGALPTVLADSGTVLAVAGRGVSISTDGGATWGSGSGLVGTFASVGFESTTVGRAVSADGSQIWTTRNAGRTWTESTP